MVYRSLAQPRLKLDLETDYCNHRSMPIVSPFENTKLSWLVLLFLSIVAIVLGAGCQAVDEKKPSLSLPPVTMNDGAVALQVAVVQLDSDQRELLEQFWTNLDSVKLPLPVRRIADKNGLRYAIMSSRGPALLDTLLERRPLDTSNMTSIHKQMAKQGLLESPPRLLRHQRIENDTGEEFDVPVSNVYQEQKWKLVDENGDVESAQGELVKAFVQFTTFPQGNGSVRIVVQPAVHHGLPQPRFDVAQRNFLFSESQIEERLAPLKFSVDLRPGESIVLAPVNALLQTARPNVSNSDQNAQESDVGLSIGDLFFGQPPQTPLALANQNAPTQRRQLIEQAFQELDKAFADQEVDDFASDLETPTDSKSESQLKSEPTVKPMCRFLMVRVVQVQMNDLFESSEPSERLTTINQ